ncbi:histidinol dehydrogenase [Mangrovivirga sp. M17]|uniref:Histidinol dehydrogenase n=1 Tax=Mangrovivirga halotolerans TaxID=2993936 RepID=A0ABT3RKY7_9BACT|nr:histidinol dehydrogenase [Mangrovivirga halotolerans]MCX2742493.1 histidinol dehydrogenase [Mangrovivirga halotolerans]
MKIIKNPSRSNWKEILARPTSDISEMENVVKPILEEIKKSGDTALDRYCQKFDGIGIEDVRIASDQISKSEESISEELKSAIDQAAINIRKFHESQVVEEKEVETMPGVTCYRKSVGIEKVGLYIPGGTAPLFSTILMLAIPAKIAGCKEIILCTPPNVKSGVHPAMLYAAKVAGVSEIYKIGGAQAIAAMAYGTQSVPQVYKIFGPGNQFVTAAKQLLNSEGVAIDMPAGPSEVLVYAGEGADPEFIAADLLSQAEHGVDSQVVFVTVEEDMIQKVQNELTIQLEKLPRKNLAEKALENSMSIFMRDEKNAIELINSYAPEHLILCGKNADEISGEIINAGSVFIGNYTPESAGDYASGTNHTLPTNGFARAYSGVSVDSFVKKITFQKITEKGLRNIGNTVMEMAEAENLDAHKNAVKVRLSKLASND